MEISILLMIIVCVIFFTVKKTLPYPLNEISIILCLMPYVTVQATLLRDLAQVEAQLHILGIPYFLMASFVMYMIALIVLYQGYGIFLLWKKGEFAKRDEVFNSSLLFSSIIVLPFPGFLHIDNIQILADFISGK